MSTYPKGRNFHLFRSLRQTFWDILRFCRKSEISQIHRTTTEWPWTLNSEKYPYTLSTSHTPHTHPHPHPPRSKFWPVSLYNRLFLRYKIVERRNVTNTGNDLRMTLNTLTVKVPWKLSMPSILPMGAIFWLGSPHEQPLSRYHAFYNSRLTTMPNTPKMNTKICTKFEISLFLTTLVETIPMRIHDFWGVNLACTWREDVVWNFFSRMVLS